MNSEKIYKSYLQFCDRNRIYKYYLIISWEKLTDGNDYNNVKKWFTEKTKSDSGVYNAISFYGRKLDNLSDKEKEILPTAEQLSIDLDIELLQYVRSKKSRIKKIDPNLPIPYHPQYYPKRG
tara:strand:+ start:3397 stop:3762 length:366 start_codon:yes stop_codon:yes gene_type:complete